MSELRSSRSSIGVEVWVGALSAGQESNWDICKEKSLWGSGANSAGGVKTGDEFFIWQSGSGWFAWCVVTSDAVHPTKSNPAPWDDGRDYKWIFGIRVKKELEPTYNPGSTDNRQKITGIPNIRLGQFPKLAAHEASAVKSFFGLVNPPNDPESEINDALDDEAETEIRQRAFDGPVEKLQPIKARRGQGVFRHNLELIEKSCRVTGLRDLQHLRASHIKPWRKSSDLEKVDGNNGLLLSPHVDHLFDRGWIKFQDDGTLVPSPRLDLIVLQSWRIEPDRDLRPFIAQQIDYLEYHRESVFKQ